MLAGCLNVAHMTLGEYPGKVDPKYLVSIDHYLKSEFDIGKFRDIGEQVKANRFNMAGGAVMEDFDNDGLLDLATTSFDPTLPMTYYKNSGDGTFAELSKPAGLTDQLGGKNLVQTDFNNDGHMDLFISRARGCPHRSGRACWLTMATAPSETSPRKRGCLIRSIRPTLAGAITTTTDGSTFLSSASNRPTACITTVATEHLRK